MWYFEWLGSVWWSLSSIGSCFCSTTFYFVWAKAVGGDRRWYFGGRSLVLGFLGVVGYGEHLERREHKIEMRSSLNCDLPITLYIQRGEFSGL